MSVWTENEWYSRAGRAHRDARGARPSNGGEPESLDEDAVIALVGRVLAEEARRNGVDLS